jgi:hypothetical protein
MVESPVPLALVRVPDEVGAVDEETVVASMAPLEIVVETVKVWLLFV